MTEAQYLTLCKQAINNRQEMLKDRADKQVNKTEVTQLTEGEFIRLKGEAGKNKDLLFQEKVKKQEGSTVYFYGFRTPFTIKGKYLKRGKDLWMIR